MGALIAAGSGALAVAGVILLLTGLAARGRWRAGR